MRRLFGLRLLEGIAVTKVVNFAGSFTASLVFIAEGRVQWGIGVPMSAAALLGGWLGAHLALRGGRSRSGAFYLLWSPGWGASWSTTLNGHGCLATDLQRRTGRPRTAKGVRAGLGEGLTSVSTPLIMTTILGHCFSGTPNGGHESGQ